MKMWWKLCFHGNSDHSCLISTWLSSWLHHQMETLSRSLALCVGNSPVTSEFPSKRPAMLRFDIIFDLCLNKRLSKQLWGWWVEKLFHPLWCHCNVDMQFHQISYELSEVSVTWDPCSSAASVIDMDVTNKLTPTYQQPYSLIHIDHDWLVFRTCIQVSQP